MSIWQVSCGMQNQIKVLVWTVLTFGVVCGRGGLSGLHRGGRAFGGLGMKGQTDESLVRNIFEDSCNEEGSGSEKDIF